MYCCLQINKDRDNGVTTVVELRGTEEAQQKAKQLIEDLTAGQNSYGSSQYMTLYLPLILHKLEDTHTMDNTCSSFRA
jgi:hypothetical protein